jgi:carboxyl-terminal processing protease
MNLASWASTLLSGGVFFSAWLLVPLPVGWSQSRNATAVALPAPLTPEQRERNLESFEHVWRTIRDKHYDPRLGGLDWQAVHDELRPQMEQADTLAKCREVLTNMVQRLGQSHFSIIPHEVYEEIKQDSAQAGNRKNEEPASSGAVSGVDVRVVDGQALVVRLDEGTPAGKLGVRPGWQILKIDGQELGPAFDKVRRTSKRSTYLDSRLRAAVVSRLCGKNGETKEILFRDGDDKETALRIPLAPPQGTRTQFGSLPAFYVTYEARTLKQNIGYFRLNAFLDPVQVMAAFEAAVKDNLRANGFIIDVRGNPGGIGLMAIGMGNWFVNQPRQKLGTLITREAELKFVLNPRPETFNGPLAILVDGCSMSTSEILAGGLRDLQRARLFGSPTAGAALPSQIERLPNGDGFQYVFANYISTGGKRLEGVGVHPDHEVAPNRRALLEGHDAILDAAVKWVCAQQPPEDENK